MLKTLHQLCVIVMILSFSLMEIGHSVRMCSAYAEGETPSAFQEENPNELGDYTGGKKECGEGESSDKDDCFDSVKSSALDRLTNDRWISSFMMIVLSMTAIGAAKDCISGVRSGMMSGICALSTIPLSIGALAYIVGEIILIVSTTKNYTEKLKFNQENLDEWSNFCKEWNGHDSRKKAVEALESGALESFKPGGQGEMFELAEDSSTYGFEIYCDQVAAVQVQSAALKEMKDAFETKKSLTLTAGVSFIVAGLVELVQLFRQWAHHADEKSALGLTIACLEKEETEKRIQTALNTASSATPPDPNPQLFETLCLNPIKACTKSLQSLYSFLHVYGEKSQATETTPMPSNTFVCIADYVTSETARRPSEKACYFALASCERIKTNLVPNQSATSTIGAAVGIVQKCLNHYVTYKVAEAESAEEEKCSIPPLASDGFNSEIQSAMDERSRRVKRLLGDGPEVPGLNLVLGMDPQELIDAEYGINVRNLVAEYQALKAANESGDLSSSVSVRVIEQAMNAKAAEVIAGNKAMDACAKACTEKETPPTTPAGRGLLFNEPADWYSSNGDLEKAVEHLSSMFSMVMSTANAGGSKDFDNNEGTQWMSLLPFAIGLIVLAVPYTRKVMSFFYYHPGIRLIFIGVMQAVVWLNYSHTSDTVEALQENITELDGMIDLLKSETTATGANPSTASVTQQSSADFENYADLEYEEDNLGVKTPCPAGGDGRGGCKSVGKSLKATLKALEVNGLAGISNSMEELADELGGTDSISENAMKASNNLNNAIGKVKNVKERLMKELNDKRSKLGLPPFDPEPATKKLVSGLKNAIRNSKNPQIQAALSGQALASAKPEVDKNEKDLLDKLKEKKKGGVEETKKDEDFMSGLNFDFKPKEQNFGGGDFDLEDEANRVSDLDIRMDDVTKTSGANIFNVISTRYFKTAYPRLLEEK